MQKFDVHVLEGAQAEVRTVTVHIDVSQKQAKAYRGGFKDKRNGTLYHNADCQTDKQVGMLITPQSCCTAAYMHACRCVLLGVGASTFHSHDIN